MKCSKRWSIYYDEILFNSMKETCQSDNERMFIEKLLYKEQWECSLSNDLLMSEYDNEDGIFIVRVLNNEYIVGKLGKETEEMHVMNFSEAAAINLRDIGHDEDITLLEWLRRRDYKGIDYEHDYDYL